MLNLEPQFVPFKHVILKMILLWAENEPPVTAHAHEKRFVTAGNRWIENAAKITGVQYQILLSLLGHFTIFLLRG